MGENRLSRLSWWLHLLATLLVTGIAASVVVVAFLFATDPNAVELTDFQVPAANIVVGPVFWLGFVISLIPTAFAIWAILLLRKLFRCYIAHEVLTAYCATLIKKSGLALLIMAILRIVLQPVVTVLMSWSGPPGERVVSLGIGTQDISFFFVAGLLVVIGWAMNEAAGAATENKAFV